MKIMVRTISLILVILTVLSFVSCAARLEGKYELEDDSVLNSNTLVGKFNYNEFDVSEQGYNAYWYYDAKYDFVFNKEDLQILFKCTCGYFGDPEMAYDIQKEYLYPYTIDVEEDQYYLKLEYEFATPEGEFLIDLFEDYATKLPISFDGTTLMIAEKKCKAVGDIPQTVSHPISFEFSGDEAKLVVENRVLDHVVSKDIYRGTYEIKNHEITFDFDKDYGNKWSDSFDFEEKGESIFIDNIEYEK